MDLYCDGGFLVAGGVEVVILRNGLHDVNFWPRDLLRLEEDGDFYSVSSGPFHIFHIFLACLSLGSIFLCVH